jgi:hypothetical protein
MPKSISNTVIACSSVIPSLWAYVSLVFLIVEERPVVVDFEEGEFVAFLVLVVSVSFEIGGICEGHV